LLATGGIHKTSLSPPTPPARPARQTRLADRNPRTIRRSPVRL
jgi:hypothetical protein